MKWCIALALACCMLCCACGAASLPGEDAILTVPLEETVSTTESDFHPKEHVGIAEYPDMAAEDEPLMGFASDLALSISQTRLRIQPASADADQAATDMLQQGTIFLPDASAQMEQKQLEKLTCDLPDWIVQTLTDELNDALKQVETGKWVQITCYISHRSEELLSLLIQLEIEAEPVPVIIPLTFDIQNEKRFELADFFLKEDDTWRRVLPDIVTEQADQQDIVLLSDLLPISDAQEFYIQHGAIVLLYRPYEITTYQAGIPAFLLPMDKISAYLSGACGITGGGVE